MSSNEQKTVVAGKVNIARYDDGNPNGWQIGYQSTDNDAIYPPFGSVEGEIIVNDARIMAVLVNYARIAGKTYVTSSFMARDRAAFDWQSVTINGKTYPRTSFTNVFPAFALVLSAVVLHDVDFLEGQPMGAEVDVTFQL